MPIKFDLMPARVPDVTVARTQPIDRGATYVFDLGYYHFSWFSALHRNGCRFVTRLKSHTHARVVAERCATPGGVVRADREIRIDGRLKSVRGSRHPLADVPLREVDVVIETGKTLRVLTNDLEAPADVIAELSKTRWRTELFFRWVKQHLTINSFIGTSENAIRTQIAVAMIA